MAISSAAQEAGSAQKPQVKVNVLNVCSPSKDDQAEIAAALSKIASQPAFSQDFEVDRGRSVLDPNTSALAAIGANTATTGNAEASPSVADFVRVRHDITNGIYSAVQYSFSRDSKQMVETLVFRVRDPKDLLQVSIEDSASSVTSLDSMLSATTPASRIKLERFGKSSVVLARCQSVEGGTAVDQSAYEPLFASASSALVNYRRLLGATTLVPGELSRLKSPGMHASGKGVPPKRK